MLETKKYSLIEWIISVADEKIIDRLQSLKSNFEDSRLAENKILTSPFSSYRDIQSRKVNLDELKTQQGYRSTTSAELSKIANEANIQESIEHLLVDLKSLG